MVSSKFFALFAFPIVAFAAGCGSIHSRTTVAESSPLVEALDPAAEESALAQAEMQKQIEVARAQGHFDGLSEEASRVLREILAEDVLLRESPDQSESGARPRIPMEVNQAVLKWIDYFSIRDRERFQRFLERGDRFEPMVKAVLKEYAIPADLFYLALIESGYQTHAKSRARAVGTWQFMRATGKLYGLQVDSMVDDRLDPMRSTRAAARHLRDLHERYGSWYLALAAYNAGVGRIDGAIRRGKSRNFWTLANRRPRVLPQETMQYVPKFLAAVMIGKNPSRFGFKRSKDDLYPKLELVEVPNLLRLKDLSRLSEIDETVLREVNPQLKRGITPSGKKGYSLWVPQALVSSVKRIREDQYAQYRVPHREVIRAMAVYEREERSSRRRPSSLGKTPLHSGSYKAYRVKSGDNLFNIAQRFGMSVGHLKRVNGLRRSQIFAGQSLKVAAGRL
jgi:membrane-bound lytic murein transglycosylase D